MTPQRAAVLRHAIALGGDNISCACEVCVCWARVFGVGDTCPACRFGGHTKNKREKKR